MSFPLVPVPEWLANLLPAIFNLEAHWRAANELGPLLLFLTVCFFFIPPMLYGGIHKNVDKEFYRVGFVGLGVCLLTFCFGSYFTFLIMCVAVIAAVIFLIRSVKKAFSPGEEY